MRRLPVYLLLDVSGSMTGEPIEAVRNGVQMLVHELRKNPQALETTYLSVITFESSAQQLVPLTDLLTFQEPELEAGGATALGEALELLSQKIDAEVTKTTPETKGDWKPLVFIMTDGQPTDDLYKGCNEIKKRKATIIACAAGFDADTNVLKQITDNVVQLKSSTSDDLAKFFKWVTSSIATSSVKINLSKETEGLSELPPPPGEIQIIV